jgi:hypothetical protein
MEEVINTLLKERIVAIKGYRPDRRKSLKDIDAVYFLMSDGETVICLEEQDYYSYHDCSTSARHIESRKDKRFWDNVMANEDGRYPDATDLP